MNAFDGVVVLLILGMLMLGYNIGFVRQFYISWGLVVGLFISVTLQNDILLAYESPQLRLVVAIVLSVLCTALCVFLLFRFATWVHKRFSAVKLLRIINSGLGSLFGGLTVLVVMWIVTPIMSNLPVSFLADQAISSRILTTLNETWPTQPTAVARVAYLINPFNPPRLFIGFEPQQERQSVVVDGQAVELIGSQTAKSVVKVSGQACGLNSIGSGFYATENLVVTNAHVVAGVEYLFVDDQAGRHPAEAVWYDPRVDFAILRLKHHTGAPLALNDSNQHKKTAAVVLGYPDGGPYKFGQAVVLDSFTARGYDIYDQERVSRGVYSLQASIVSGNSGGPLINTNGEVIGVVFGHSTEHPDVGYALSLKPVTSALESIGRQSAKVVSTGACGDL